MTARLRAAVRIVREAAADIRAQAESLVWWVCIGLLVVCPMAYEIGCTFLSR